MDSEGKSAFGWVYFVEAPACDAIKIGWTTGHPHTRLANLQTGCPVDLELVAAIRGAPVLEGEIHERFAEHAIRGDWFRDVPAIWDYLVAEVRSHPRGGMLASYPLILQADGYSRDYVRPRVPKAGSILDLIASP